MSDSRVYAAPNPAAERATEAPPAAAGNRALWFAVFAPPVAWNLDLLLSITLHEDYCAALVGHQFQPFGGLTAMLVVLGLLMLALSLAGGAVAWRALASLGSPATGRGETVLDRRRFMAAFALVGCALFTYGLVLRFITVFFISPSRCGP
jgi:hypothetical protein